MIIGIGHKARSGKDTIAYHLMGKYGFARRAFADSLKEAAQVIFRLSQEQMNGNHKEDTDSRWKCSPRQIMQTFGTECMRHCFGENIWVKSLRAYMLQYPDVLHWVIPDVRFKNEAEAIKQWGGILWRVDRPEALISLHESEKALDGYRRWDRIFVNDKSPQELLRQVDEVFR